MASALKTYLTARGFQAELALSLSEIERVHFADLPSLVLLELRRDTPAKEGLLKELALSHVPVICYSTHKLTVEQRMEVLEEGAVDCLPAPLDPREVFLRARNLLSFTAAGNLHPFMASLPGNSAGAARLKRLLEDAEHKWALIWISVDHFSTFCQAYGYDAGNEALQIVAGALSEGIRVAGRKWDAAYWVGGEDFVLFTVPDLVRALADSIFASFDQRIGGLYSPADRRAGHVTVKDRRGRPFQAPLLSLSMGVVSNELRSFSDAWQVRQVADEVRAKARQIPGNSLYIDTRKA